MPMFEAQPMYTAAPSIITDLNGGEAAQSWCERVTLAKAAADPDLQRALLIALVQEALTPGYQVHIVARQPADGAVAPAQYQVAPAVNFDCNLESKQYWPRAGRTGLLGARSGYFFATGDKAYAILGPGAIEEYTPLLTRMAADHELFHTTQHVGKRVGANEELEAWVDAFVHYFHQIYLVRKSWSPMIAYYERANRDAQEGALATLTQYFGQQPATIQTAMLTWLTRRHRDLGSKQLVLDLETRLPQLPHDQP